MPPPNPSPLSPSADAIATGGTLHVAQAFDIESLDPWTASEPDTLIVLRQVFETLVAQQPGGYGVVPSLADRWIISPDGLTWSFHLRSGVRFHDGTTFDAAAVVYNFERARGIARLDLGSLVTSVVASDESTVVFRLGSPFASFLATLAAPSFGIVSPACIKQGPSWASPASRCAAGTGPFKIAPGAWKSGELVTLSRNANYWGKDASTGRALPFLDSVTFQPVRDEATRVGALKTAAIDLALDLGPTSVRAVGSDPNVAPAHRPAFAGSFIGIGAAKPFDVLGVRRAAALAVDRAAIVQSVYGGDAKPAAQLVPPGLLGYDDSIRLFTPNDSAAARKLLADAGLASGFSTELWYAADFTPALPDPKRVAESLAADLAKIGINAAVRSEDATTLAADAGAGVLPLWIGQRTPARADADEFLSGATANLAALELLRRARGELDESKRAELYKQVTKIIQQEIPRIPLVNASPALGLSRKVRGFVPQPVGGESFAAVWIGR